MAKTPFEFGMLQKAISELSKQYLTGRFSKNRETKYCSKIVETSNFYG